MAEAIAASTIAKQAFREMELRPIGSFADNSPQAQDAAEQYPLALKFCLEIYDWSFARRVQELPPAALDAGVSVDPDLPGIFRLPPDCVKLRHIYPKDLRYRLDERVIRCEQETTLTVRYTRLIENESELPASFQTVVSLELARRLSPQWVGSRTKRADIKDDFAGALSVAKQNDAFTASPDRLDGRDAQPDWASEATAWGSTTR